MHLVFDFSEFAIIYVALKVIPLNSVCTNVPDGSMRTPRFVSKAVKRFRAVVVETARFLIIITYFSLCSVSSHPFSPIVCDLVLCVIRTNQYRLRRDCLVFW